MKSLQLSYLLGLLLATMVTTEAFAFTDCPRPVQDVFNNFNPGVVWVGFTDGGKSIAKEESELTSAQLNRFYSVALLAKVTGKRLSVRYPETGVCDDIINTGSARYDTEGVWLLD